MFLLNFIDIQLHQFKFLKNLCVKLEKAFRLCFVSVEDMSKIGLRIV